MFICLDLYLDEIGELLTDFTLAVGGGGVGHPVWRLFGLFMGNFWSKTCISWKRPIKLDHLVKYKVITFIFKIVKLL